MNKTEFLSCLAFRLSSLPFDERETAVKYYEEYFGDAGEENEQAIIAELGSPDAVADSIIKDYFNTAEDAGEPVNSSDADASTSEQQLSTTPPPQDQVPPPNANQPRSSQKSGQNAVVSILLILLVVFVIFPLFIGLSSAVISVATGFLGAMIGLLTSGIALIIEGIFSGFSTADSIMCTGVGLILISLSMVFAAGSAWLAFKVFPALIRFLVKVLKDPFNNLTKQISTWVNGGATQ